MVLRYQINLVRLDFNHAHFTGKDGGCVFTATRTIVYIKEQR